LRKKEPERTLYLAVPEAAYKDFFSIDFIREGVEEDQVKLLVYEPDLKEIVRWIN